MDYFEAMEEIFFRARNEAPGTNIRDLNRLIDTDEDCEVWEDE